MELISHKNWVRMLMPCLHFLFARWLYGGKFMRIVTEGPEGAVVFMTSAFSSMVIVC